MSTFADWRVQAALFGINAAGGDPINSVKQAECKYRQLIGRELGMGELHMLNDLVIDLIEKEKLKILNKSRLQYQLAKSGDL